MLESKEFPKELIVLPPICNVLGGTLVTLALLIKGVKQTNTKLAVLVQSNSLMEDYLKQYGYEDYIQLVPSSSKQEFLREAIRWVNQQPRDVPLLLDNCVDRSIFKIMLQIALPLRLSGRPIYHFFHDLALSYNHLGFLTRKLIFSILAPRALCNSYFTATHIRSLTPKIHGILYQPVDTEKFNSKYAVSPPADLLPILSSGAKVILTPSRISLAGMINDKNLRGIIPVLAHLKAMGQFYHGVIIGEDTSADGSHRKELLEMAEQAGIADRFTILAPSFTIQDYYRFANVVLTLAPREPFGRVVVEAIACGVPVIGSETGGIGEILSQCAPEWMVNPADPAQVAQKIHQLSSDPNRPNAIAKAQNWVDERCNVSVYAQNILEITQTYVPKQIAPNLI
jgi:glycosyltransferase involved in cell wall biosynthesis